MLEAQVNSQLKQFLADNIFSENQSGFRSSHSTITAPMLVTKDVISTLDREQHCPAMFVDLSKAFDLLTMSCCRLSDANMDDKVPQGLSLAPSLGRACQQL